MDSNKKDITIDIEIEEQLNSSQNDEPTYKGLIQLFHEKIDDFKTMKEILDKDDEHEVNLLCWISLALLAALGTLFIIDLIAGLVQLLFWISLSLALVVALPGTFEARRLEKNRNEKVRKIEEQLSSSQNEEPTFKGPIQMFQEKVTDYFKTIKEDLDNKLVPVFQDDEHEVNLCKCV